MKKYIVLVFMNVSPYRTPEMEKDSRIISQEINFMYDKEGALKLREDILQRFHPYNIRVRVIEEEYERREINPYPPTRSTTGVKIP